MRMVKYYINYRQGCGSGYAKESSPGQGRNCRLLSEWRGEKVCLVFLLKHLHLCLFPILCSVISVGQGSLFSVWLARQGKVLLSLLKTSECLCSDGFSGSLARPRVWSYFGLLFLIKNEISSIWVLANHQSKGQPTWFYKPGSSQCVVFENNRLGQPDVVEILKGGMCEKEKRKNYKFKK